ncbi:Scr1 family TA system antitoxin-like transcriptional regulator [Streptomyces sp. E11-3]|uniref:Scr1 family TA system antitoxin-like transcriptional regulator n=1 Tax=Streptomyces sp. E11-3 TaxID=3110112 RepID=UPI003981285D
MDKADEVSGANDFISAMKEEMAKARYPRNVRELAKLEERAVEMPLYSNHNVHGLLQTKEYTQALLSVRRPAYSRGELERMAAGRMDRQSIFERSPAPELGFIQEEVTLRRLSRARRELSMRGHVTTHGGVARPPPIDTEAPVTGYRTGRFLRSSKAVTSERYSSHSCFLFLRKKS